MRVPTEVDVQRRDEEGGGTGGHEVQEGVVASYGADEDRMVDVEPIGVRPSEIVHFLNKGALAKNLRSRVSKVLGEEETTKRTAVVRSREKFSPRVYAERIDWTLRRG